jgi:xanthine dehydrogenase FAD-binding subunit
MRHHDYLRPRSLDAALALLAAHPGALLIAGGTDLVLLLRDPRSRPPAVISLRSVPELKGRSCDGETRIGAGETIHDLLRDPELRRACPVLVQAAARLGSPQVRSVATVGGNLANASPCADTATPLLVHEAELILRSAAGVRRVPLDRFFVGPKATCLTGGEILEAVVLPPAAPGTHATFLKHGRVGMDLAVTSLCVRLDLEGTRCQRARVAAGSVAPTPVRLRAAERALEGQTITPAVIAAAVEAARDEVAPISDVRASADFRRHLVGVFLQRAVARLLEGVRS